jgi:flagellar biosynthesis/type III secretory pathway protein FliH
VVTKADAEKLIAAADQMAKQEGRAAGYAEGQESGRKDAQTRALKILEVCARAGMEKMAPALIQKGTALETARAEVLAAKAVDAERTQIRSSVSSLSTGEVNPLLADAKKRAKG